MNPMRAWFHIPGINQCHCNLCSWEPSRAGDMSIPITEPPVQESDENSSDSNKDDNEQHENEPEHNDSNDNEPNNKNNAMNNNIIHADNPNSIGGGSMLAMRMRTNTRRMVQRALGMIGAKYRTTGYVADGTIEHSAFTCSG